MSHQNLKVNVRLQSINQPQLCEKMLETMTRYLPRELLFRLLQSMMTIL